MAEDGTNSIAKARASFRWMGSSRREERLKLLHARGITLALLAPCADTPEEAALVEEASRKAILGLVERDERRSREAFEKRFERLLEGDFSRLLQQTQPNNLFHQFVRFNTVASPARRQQLAAWNQSWNSSTYVDSSLLDTPRMTAVSAVPHEPGSMSPSSSPRLPSPPPFPEVQTAPKSPLHDDAVQLPALPKGISRRIRPGTKAADMRKGPPLVPLSELNSPFQLQEYLKALHHKETHDIDGDSKALSHEAALRLATPPEGVERSLWLYELCRLMIMRVNMLIVGFFNDNPKCDAQNCPEMRASEWQYLCAVHDPPKSCCAIDYCCHTLDWAATLITSTKHFPSRLTLGGDGGASQQGIRQLTNIFRRVYRMFAHAWFQHREVFWKLECQEGLYILYKTICMTYNLMPADTYTVPPEAEGLSAAEEAATAPRQQESKRDSTSSQTQKPSQIPIRPKIDREGSVVNITEAGGPVSTFSTAATTKRHKHTPSTGSFVPTITEGDEEPEGRAPPEREVPLDEAEALSTVRYDPKDIQLVPPPEEATEELSDDTASEVTMIIDPPVEEDEEVTSSEAAHSSEVHAGKLDEEAKSPVTPIDDEPSPVDEDDSKPIALQSKDEPSEAKELTGGAEVGAVSAVPHLQGAIADEENGDSEEEKVDV